MVGRKTERFAEEGVGVKVGGCMDGKWTGGCGRDECEVDGVGGGGWTECTIYAVVQKFPDCLVAALRGRNTALGRYVGMSTFVMKHRTVVEQAQGFLCMFFVL